MIPTPAQAISSWQPPRVLEVKPAPQLRRNDDPRLAGSQVCENERARAGTRGSADNFFLTTRAGSSWALFRSHWV